MPPSAPIALASVSIFLVTPGWSSTVRILRYCTAKLEFRFRSTPMADLNPPNTNLEDVTPQIHALEALANLHGHLSAPPRIRNALDLALAHFSMLPIHPTLALPPPSPVLVPNPNTNPSPDVQRHVKINRKTKLDALYTYKPGTLVEYPQTSQREFIGHLFLMDPTSDWLNPARDIVYSQGEPRGSSGKKTVFCDILVSSDGEKIPCRESHSTCT